MAASKIGSRSGGEQQQQQEVKKEEEIGEELRVEVVTGWKSEEIGKIIFALSKVEHKLFASASASGSGSGSGHTGARALDCLISTLILNTPRKRKRKRKQVDDKLSEETEELESELEEEGEPGRGQGDATGVADVLASLAKLRSPEGMPCWF